MLYKLKKIDYRHYICAAITICFILFTVFSFPDAFHRLLEAFKDFGTSAAYWFCFFFDIEYVRTPGVVVVPELPPATEIIIPETVEGFKSNWTIFWQLFFDKNNFKGYVASFSGGLEIFARILVIILPFIMLIHLKIKSVLEKENNDYNIDTRQLRRFKKLSEKTYIPIKAWIVSFIDFVKEHKLYYIIWLCVWLFNFNAFAIIISFLGFYLYFSVTFNFGDLYTQVYKLCVDLVPLFTFWPAWIILISLGLYLFNQLRRERGFAKLNHMEAMNKGFIASLPIFIMIVNSMGSGKTTLMTDMSLSLQEYFRFKAYEFMIECDLKFPYFPWINLELEIKKGIKKKYIYNLATCRRFINSKQTSFKLQPTRLRCFGYDYEKYNLDHNDNLSISGLFDVLKDYAQLYFIYVIQTSLLISNYAIRDDAQQIDLGNFPIWDSDFFRRDPRRMAAMSRHSHILDYDMLRLGKKIINNPKTNGALEFGVIAETEGGKNRGNQNDLKEIDAKEDPVNQKNDLFNLGRKMDRHSATICNFCFKRYIMDEQRASSISADLVNLATVVSVGAMTEPILAIPSRYFFIEELLHDLIFNKFKRFYGLHRFNRGDNTLFVHIYKTVAAKLHNYYVRTYNQFGYRQMSLLVGAGIDIERKDLRKEHTYYIISKKIYSRRFSTDCFSEFFTDKALTAEIGIMDFPEYKTEKATLEELYGQQSYFMNKLKKLNSLESNIETDDTNTTNKKSK